MSKDRIIVLFFLVFLLMPLAAQLSPGKLSQSHANLEGMSNCTKCHVLGEKVSNEKCLDCHQHIASRIKLQKGYHASADVNGKDCFKCHSDHHGRNFQMIHFNTDEFDHSKTGYNLQGAHAEKLCSDCHKSENIRDARIKQKSSTYLGLEQNCLSCHNNYHQGTLSNECSSCHDFNAFNPASKFKHSNARFKLRGKHVSVACNKCHKTSVFNGIEMQKFAGVLFENCTSCHSDIHNNKFGQNCTQCHSEESFKKIKQLSNFNHSKTSYPLEGKHQFVSCAKCHKSQYTASLRYQKCTDCHSDYHKKQFALQGKSPDCSDCHSTQGFDRSEYTIERHNESEFRLIGAHAATPCFACHKKSNKWSFRQIGTRCSDCHQDFHESHLDKKYYPEASCQSCHNSNRWSEVDFDHSNTNYILEGAHRRQSCRSCHFNTDTTGAVLQEFSGLSSGCLNCHQDVHYGQFEDRDGSVCLTCHGYDNWSPDRFDHDNTAFSLDGKHQDVACNKCHIPTVSAGVFYTQYKLENYSCESCH